MDTLVVRTDEESIYLNGKIGSLAIPFICVVYYALNGLFYRFSSEYK